MGMKEFHFGLCMTTVVDVQIAAETEEAAHKIFEDASGNPELMEALPKAVLDKHYEVLGMIEGPLPIAPVEDTVH